MLSELNEIFSKLQSCALLAKSCSLFLLLFLARFEEMNRTVTLFEIILNIRVFVVAVLEKCTKRKPL